MPETLLQCLFRLLNSTVEPIVGPLDAAAYPAHQLLELTAAGILRETSRANEISRPVRFGPGANLVVTETARGLYGVASDDDFSTPLPLIDADVKQYSISLARLVSEIRHANEIRGTGLQVSDGLVVMGTKLIAGVGSVPVYLSLPNTDETDLLARCLRTKRGTSESMAAVIVPEDPSASAELQRILDDNSIRLLGITGAAGLADLRVDWASAFRQNQGEPPGAAKFVFRNKGQFWELAFEGKPISVRATKGVAYIAELLRSPGREIFVAELFGAANGMTTVPIGSSGEIIDRTALRGYRDRAEDLRDQLAEADKNNDSGRREAINAELEKLGDQMLAARGLSGRLRHGQDDRDRIRKSVSMAIDRAIKAIQKDNPPLAKHLDLQLKRGYFPSYSADIFWEL